MFLYENLILYEIVEELVDFIQISLFTLYNYFISEVVEMCLTFLL